MKNFRFSGSPASQMAFWVPTLAILTASFSTLHAQRIRDVFRFEPEIARIRTALTFAPGERETAVHPAQAIIELPDPRGNILQFNTTDAPLLAPDFAARYPDFRTYALTDPASGIFRGQLFISRFGLQALVFSDEGPYIIRPADRLSPVLHEAFFEDLSAVACDGAIEPDAIDKGQLESPESAMLPNGSTIRTYRLAVVTTGEYYQGNGNTMPLVDAAVVTDVSNLTAIYKRELAITFTLLAPVHYTNPSSDPFVPDESLGVPRASQAAAVIGANFAQGDYDLGHVFHKGTGGGVAFRTAVCNNTPLADPDGSGTRYTTGGFYKGRGWSGDTNNQTFEYAWLLAHEVGHMFGARHTFNATGGSCTNNIDPLSSYEIGSGSTIVSYVSNCGPGQAIPYGGVADHYYHSKSLEQMLTHINGAGNCSTTAASGNQPPVVDANPCGDPLVIPKSTPFTLTGSGSDPDGHTVYYCWEQIDEDGPGVPTQGYVGATAGNSPIAPLFRSYPPTTSPSRTFPALTYILNNANAANFEALPAVGRTLNFRLQGRDLQLYGAINNSDVAVLVDSTKGPLSVTAPNGGESWTSGDQTVTWTANGTETLSPNVRITMSIDGGQTFPLVLAASTPNDGSETVSLPLIASSTMARIKVESIASSCLTFFDISNANFSFSSACAAQASVICPSAALTLTEGDPGLDLSFLVQQNTTVTSKAFTLTSGDPTMNLVRWDATQTMCETPGGTEPNYRVFKFTVSADGTYSFSFGAFNYRAVHLFANSFDPSGGCSNFVTSSVIGNTFYNGFLGGAVLSTCVEYYLVITNQYGGFNNTTVLFSGPGVVREIFSPVADYAYTYLALDTANDQVVAVSPTAAFGGLTAGNYRIYGAHYKSSGAEPPANVDPNGFIGQTIAQLLNTGTCFNLSANYLPLTVEPPPSPLVINEVDYHQALTDDAEFIELKNVSDATVDLADWTLELVDGAGGGATVYQTISLPAYNLPAGAYFVVCGNSAKVSNCNHVVTPATDLIQNGGPDAIGLRKNGQIQDALSYQGNAAAPYTEGAGVSPGDDGTGIGHGLSRFPDGADTDDNSADFISDVCITPGGPNVNTVLELQASVTALYCFETNDGEVALMVSGGSAPYVYLWNNNQTGPTALSLSAGTYTATVTDAYGCAAITSANVPQPDEIVISADVTPINCPGNMDGAIALTVAGGVGPYQYDWSGGQTTQNINNLSPGTYTVIVTDDTGCSATISATISEFPAGADLCLDACTLCNLNGFTGSTEGYTGQTPPGFCGTVENDQWLGFTAGDTSVTITATPSNCANGNGIQIALFSACNASPIVCNGGQNGGGDTPMSVTASTTPGGTYLLMIDGYAGDQCDFIIDITPSANVEVQATVKVWLQGPYVSPAQLMHDSLRVKGLIPLTEPYTGLINFVHLGGGGGEQTTPAVLAVTGSNAIVDWVFAELRDAANPDVVLATRSALLQRDGDVVDVDGVSPLTFSVPSGPSYYLAVRHRNHLGVQLGAAKPYPPCVSVETDFRSLPSEGFYIYNGLNPAQKVISGTYALWAGNGRIDYQLKYNGSVNDRNAVLSAVGLTTPNAIVPGYLVEDYNMDGVVKYNGSANDRNVLLGNVGIATPLAVVWDQVAR